MKKNRGLLFFGMVLTLVLSACHFPPRLHRMDIRQGNELTAALISKLRQGQTKAEVREILGSPTLRHALHSHRWDYYYSFKSGDGTPVVTKHFSVFFKKGRLNQWGY